ncbi:MAG TPA: C25 family cysteine peptidase [Blastocatellia bacterium]|nr:C25 family cysteine peptidase [Blastocatellia bacterium]
MRIDKEQKFAESPHRAPHGKTRASRVMFAAILLTILAGVAVPSGLLTKASAAMQEAARRAGIVAPTKSPKPVRPVRQSKDSQFVSESVTNPDGTITAGKIITDAPIRRSTDEIMADQALAPAKGGDYVRPRAQKIKHDLSNRPAAQGAIEASQWPLAEGNRAATEVGAPQTLGTQFDGATGPTETGAFPPDTMGAVGPTQFFVFLNGRMRTFNKTTGAADAAINVDSDVFFASVLTPPLAGEVVFTSDPQVRYDRLTSRWFVNIIDVVLNAATGAVTRPNRVLIAISDAGNETITGATTWDFYQFQGDATLFTDYQSFGVDSSALYIGGDMFTTAGSFNSTKGFVVPKAPLLTGSAATVWAFSGLVATPTGAGPFAPRGVDNYQVATTTEGYFIGVDNATFNTLMLRRVTNPGSLGPSPTISANISIATPLTTRFPVLVPHLGNTGGTGGRLDGLDDRLYYAHLRNGRLWTAHSIGVNNTGVAGATNNRNAARWYELQNIASPGTPSVLQSGTLFDNNATNDANQRNYWIPTILVSGQGHAALGCSIAGTNERINAFTTGRLVGDTLGTLRDGPGGAALPGYTASATAYNPPGDPGGPSRRWGDYSHTSLDPKDDMTMWTIQEYCNGTNTYGVRAVKLIAPPPPPAANLSPNPAAIQLNNPSTNIVVTATAPAGQGFYDPGADPPAPHTTFDNISASGVGIIVNSITFTNSLQVTVNVSTVGSTSGSKTITITNPDGQTTTFNVLVGPTAAKLDSFSATSFDDGRVLVQWKSSHEADNLGFNVYREQNGQRARITPQLIAGSALVAGADATLTAGKNYVWADTPQAGNRPTQYWLEEIDLKGNRTLHGPVLLNRSPGRAPNADQSALLTRFGAHQSQITLGVGSTPLARSGVLARTSAPQVDLAGQAAVKLSVRQEGWYRVTQQELVAAGLNPSTDPRLLQLYVDGQQLPFIVTGQDDGRLDASDAMEFYGIGLDVPSTDTRTYWLVAGSQPGARISVSPTRGGIGSLPTSFAYTVERKDRTIYFSALRNGDAENFFGPVVSSEQVNQSMNIQRLAAGAATLEVALQGVTVGQHRVRVMLNGADAGVVDFSGQTRGVGRFQLPQSRLREGENSVSFVGAGQTDVSLLDYVRITYQHAYTAENNSLRFTATGNQMASVDGFSSTQVRVVDVTDPAAVVEVTGAVRRQKSGYGITFSVPGDGERTLLAFDAAQAKRPARTAANRPSSLRNTGQGADLVIVAPRDFFAAIEPLAALRRSQGLAVSVFDIEDVMDEFNFGHKAPQALKDFLSYALTSWKRAPRYALFVGDASFDARNYLGFGENDLVPTRLIDTELMETGADEMLGDVTGDGVAELSIGRLPVRTAQEASAMISKIIGYDRATASDSLLLVSDFNDGFSFEQYSNRLRPLVPGNVRVTSVTRGADQAAARRELIDAINQGQKIVNYMGHANIAEWRGNLLTSADAASLTNRDKLSVFVMMSCLNAYYDASVDSLAEALMRAEGGAVAVWASTGMTSPGGQIVINEEAYRLMFDGSVTLGEATRRAKAAVTDSDVRRTWVLLGDPSMRLR